MIKNIKIQLFNFLCYFNKKMEKIMKEIEDSTTAVKDGFFFYNDYIEE